MIFYTALGFWGPGMWQPVSTSSPFYLPIIIMANLNRSAKSSSNWTPNDLDSYHISLNQVDPLLFFGLKVGNDSFSIALEKTLTTFHIIGVATTLG
jgi:hypothetical protein